MCFIFCTRPREFLFRNLGEEAFRPTKGGGMNEKLRYRNEVVDLKRTELPYFVRGTWAKLELISKATVFVS